MPPMATAAPSPATRPPEQRGDHSEGRHWTVSQAGPGSCEVAISKGAADRSAAPEPFNRKVYFKLVTAVRSADSLTTPAAPHQFDPGAVAPLPGLMAVTKPGLKFVVL